MLLLRADETCDQHTAVRGNLRPGDAPVDDGMSDEERARLEARARTFAGPGGCRPDRACVGVKLHVQRRQRVGSESRTQLGSSS